MKYALLFILIIGFNGYSYGQGPKIKIQSGNFSGIEYIMITEKDNGKTKNVFKIDCNHYIKNMGKVLFLKKDNYRVGKYQSTFHLIKDTTMFNNMGYTLNQNRDTDVFTQITPEELEMIHKAFLKYPKLQKKYNLNIESLKNSLGWFEIKN